MINPAEIIGKRFACEFRVVAIEGPPYADDSKVTIYQYGERAEIDLKELSVLIESGFVMELPG